MLQTLRQTFAVAGRPMPWRSVAITCAATMVPPIVAVMALGRVGAVAFIASLAAHLAAKDAGLRIAAVVTLAMGLSGLIVVGNPTAGLLVAPVLGLLAGLAGYLGHAAPVMRTLITWTVFTGTILPADDKPLMLWIFLAALIWALGVTKLCGAARTGPAEEVETKEYALIFGVMLAAGLTLSVWIGGRWFGEHGFWFPLTFVVLCVPPHGKLFGRTLQRTIGTVLGTLIALAVAAVSDATWVMLAVGGLALPLAFRALPWNYTVFTTLLTIAVLEVLALVSDVSTLAWERLATMAAAAVMTGLIAAVGLFGLWLIKPEAIAALQDEG